jgi:hypothetical protein
MSEVSLTLPLMDLRMPSKKCVTCGFVRPVSDFNPRTSARDGLQDRCRPCTKEWYSANRIEHGVNTRRRKASHRQDIVDRVRLHLLDHPCVDCGATDLRVLDFDHRDPGTKLASVGRLLGQGRPWPAIDAEMAKCDVRCANCHRIRTSADFGWWRTPAQLDRVAVSADAARERLMRVLGRTGA